MLRMILPRALLLSLIIITTLLYKDAKTNDWDICVTEDHTLFIGHWHKCLDGPKD